MHACIIIIAILVSDLFILMITVLIFLILKQYDSNFNFYLQFDKY